MSEDSNYAKANLFVHRLFKYRLRSQKELELRLRQRRFDELVINRVVENFKKQGLLDDKRFAKLWAQSRLETRPASLSNIKQELLLKGIEKDVVEATINRLKEDFDEYEIAYALAQKRIRALGRVDKLKAKKRLFDYLKRRGFSSDIVFRALNEEYM
ncbi:MAG: regulatory protein RecX [Candidatus Omnitrophica bacterium]|nr:regulatory protein RecX [Candidatus Omnitrophota bacterium]